MLSSLESSIRTYARRVKALGTYVPAVVVIPLTANVTTKKRKTRLDPLKVDPTRTAPIRKRFISDMSARYRSLSKAVNQVVDEEDSFGLRDPKVPTFALNQRWKFQTDDAKLKAFQEWFKLQVESKILQVAGDGEPWLAEYVTSAYKQGAVRAFIDATAGKDKTQREFLSQAFNTPEAISKIKLLYTRTFEQLKGVSSQMSQNMARILSEGLSKGAGPREIARNLTKSINSIDKNRAFRIARTEIIHAHSEGQLDQLEKLGVTHVGVMVEWMTAGDSRVCPQCASMAGVVLPIKKARGLIPRHPNCRCTFTPANVGEDSSNQKRSKSAIQKAVERSIKAERPKKSLATAKRKSRWAGAGRKF